MRMKKYDYECIACGYILSDDEKEENGSICNECILHRDEVEDDDIWEEFK